MRWESPRCIGLTLRAIVIRGRELLANPLVGYVTAPWLGRLKEWLTVKTSKSCKDVEACRRILSLSFSFLIIFSHIFHARCLSSTNAGALCMRTGKSSPHLSSPARWMWGAQFQQTSLKSPDGFQWLWRSSFLKAIFVRLLDRPYQCHRIRRSSKIDP